MHTLSAHLHCKQFGESILTVKTQSSPSIDVVNDWLSFSLACVCKLHHADDMSSTVEAVEKVPLKLLPISMDSGLKLVYQSKVFLLTNKSSRRPAVSHVSTK